MFSNGEVGNLASWTIIRRDIFVVININLNLFKEVLMKPLLCLHSLLFGLEQFPFYKTEVP